MILNGLRITAIKNYCRTCGLMFYDGSELSGMDDAMRARVRAHKQQHPQHVIKTTVEASPAEEEIVAQIEILNNQRLRYQAAVSDAETDETAIYYRRQIDRIDAEKKRLADQLNGEESGEEYPGCSMKGCGRAAQISIHGHLFCGEHADECTRLDLPDSLEDEDEGEDPNFAPLRAMIAEEERMNDLIEVGRTEDGEPIYAIGHDER
jgi:hypothetical protein